MKTIKFEINKARIQKLETELIRSFENYMRYDGNEPTELWMRATLTIVHPSEDNGPEQLVLYKDFETLADAEDFLVFFSPDKTYTIRGDYQIKQYEKDFLIEEVTEEENDKS